VIIALIMLVILNRPNGLTWRTRTELG